MGNRQLEMIVGITGSTAGIGKTVLQLPYSFIRFDRVDGDLSDVDLVFEKFKHCDVFINNAWDGDCQTNLLKHFFEQWKDEDKKILSIGSSVASYSPTGTGHSDYVKSKKDLRKAHCEIVNLKTTRCKSYLINPGITDTKMTAKQNRKKMTTQDVAAMVQLVLMNKLYIPEVYFYAE